VDIRAMYKLKRVPVTIGASLVNLGTQVRFIEQGYSLPLTLRLGATLNKTERFPHIVSMEVEAPQGSDANLRIGIEYYNLKPFMLRMGYKTMSSEQREAVKGDSKGLEGMYGLSMGIGVESGQWKMDYAMKPYGELGNTHRFSVSLKFGTRNSFPRGYDYNKLYQPKKIAEEPIAYPVEYVKGDIEVEEDSYEEHMENAEIYWRENNRVQAFEEYEKALSLLPEDSMIRIQILERQGLLLLEQKEYIKAKKTYVKSINIAKASKVKNRDVVSAYLGLAYCLAKTGNKKWARANYKKAWKLTDSEETKSKIERSLENLKNR